MDVQIALRPGDYPPSLVCYRARLANSSDPFLWVGVICPGGETVEIRVRRSNAYVVAFKGATGWFRFKGEDDVLGEPCGFGANYNDLGKVGKVTYDDLKALARIANHGKGSAGERRLIAILIAVTSEAARFAIVETYFTGLLNSIAPAPYHAYLAAAVKVDFDELKAKYFTKWDKRGNAPGVLVPRR